MLLKNTRRKKFGIWLMVVMLIIGTFTTAGFLMREQLAGFLTIKSTEFLSKSLKVKIYARVIKGNIFSGISLSDVKINFTSGDSFYANTVKAEYDLFSIILQRRNNIRNINIIKPAIYLTRKDNQTPTVPNQNLKYALPLLFINRLEIEDGCVISNGALILDTFSIIANINLRATSARCYINKLSFYMPNKQVKIDNIEGMVNLQNNIVKLENLKIKSPVVSLNLNGQIDIAKRDVSLDINAGYIDLKSFNNQSGQIKIDGKISVSFLNATWIISDINSNLNYQINNLEIQNIPIPDGKGKLTFSEHNFMANFISLEKDSSLVSQLKIQANVFFNPFSYQGTVNFINLQLPVNSTVRNRLDGTADFAGVKTDSIDFNILSSSRKPVIESLSAQVKVRKGKLTVDKLRIKDHTNILNANGYGQITNGETEFSCNIEFINFSLYFLSEILNKYGLSDISLAGFINGHCQIHSNGNSIATSGKMTVRKGRYADLQCNQLNLQYDIADLEKLAGSISLSSDSINWHENKFGHLDFNITQDNFLLQITNWKDNSLIANGKLVTNNKNVECFIDSMQLIGIDHTFRNTRVFSFGKNDTQLFLSDFSLAIDSGTLSLDITKNRSAAPQVNLVGNRINLEYISDFVKLQQAISGIVNINLTIRENLSSYNINLSGYDLKIPTSLLSHNESPNNHSVIGLKFIEGACELTKSVFKISEMNLVYSADTSKINGTIDLKQQSSAQMPCDLNITFADPGPWVFFFLKNILEFQEGRIYGQGKLTGSLEKPVLSGGVKISDGKLFIVSTKTMCDNVNAEISFERQKIILKSLTGKTGTGRINGQGFTQLIKFSQVDTLSYKIDFQNAPLRPQKEVFAIATGYINIDYKPKNKIVPSVPLSLSGDIQIKEALLTSEFESSSSLNSTTNQSLNCNLKIAGERDIWLRNRNCDIELRADLNIFSSDKTMIYSGQLEAMQGNFYYLDHSLKLTKGLLVFDNTSELDPDLDISAELATRPIEVRPGQSERVKIILNLTGRLKEPHFVFSSDPSYLSENDIISYLTFNVTWQEMSAPELRQRFTTALSGKLLGYFERELNKRLRNLIYLDYLWIESGLISGNNAKVTVGKYIGNKLYVTYEYNISGNAYDIFRLEYNITKSHGIIGERDNESRYNLKYQYKIRY